MISSKVFALSLLLVCPFALARVRLSTNIEVSYPSQKITRNIFTEIELDVNESVLIVNDNEIRIETQLLAQEEDNVQVRYTASVKNAEGVYEVITAPEVKALYGDTAIIKLGQKSKQDNEEDYFKITLKPNKVQ